MAKQSGAQRVGAAGKRPTAAGKRTGRNGKKSGSTNKRPGGSTLAAIIVVVVVVGGIAISAFSGNLRDLFSPGTKSPAGSPATDVNAVVADDKATTSADSPPTDVIVAGHADVMDSAEGTASPADTHEDERDDGHWRDRQRHRWQNPCWTTADRTGVRPDPENDGRVLINLCDVEMPFPKSVGFDMKKTSGEIGYIKLNDGTWECMEQDQPDGEMWSCGEIHVSDVAWVDVDRDGKKEVAIYFMSNYGGNCESYQIYAYEIVGKVPKFKEVVADNDAYSCEERSLAGIEPYGKHCVKALTNCDKTCHGCEGTPCYDIFAWTGRRFETAESWIDGNDEYHTSGSVETNSELMKLCGTD